MLSSPYKVAMSTCMPMLNKFYLVQLNLCNNNFVNLEGKPKQAVFTYLLLMDALKNPRKNIR